jgi:hypothetical protein
MTGQLSLFSVVPLHRARRASPYRPPDDANRSDHADTDPPADWSALRARFAKPCQCSRPIGDDDPDDDGAQTCL